MHAWAARGSSLQSAPPPAIQLVWNAAHTGSSVNVYPLALQVLHSLNLHLSGEQALSGAAYEALLVRLEQAMQGAATYIRWGGGFGGFDGCGALALAAGCRPWRGLASSILPLLASGRTSTFCILRHAGLHRPLAPLLNLRN